MISASIIPMLVQTVIAKKIIEILQLSILDYIVTDAVNQNLRARNVTVALIEKNNCKLKTEINNG